MPAVRQKLHLASCADFRNRLYTLRYRVTDDGILLDKATETVEDPFAAFSEWTSEADEKAYDGL